jgi:phosphopantothenoylcysteine decarboxylase/phosphopantothenate--cysteine ligase
VGEASFAALTGAPVLVSEFERDPARGAFPDQQPPGHEPLSHLELVANADVYLIAPATANTIAKLAGGFAEDLLSSCALAARCPLIVAPAMNAAMYEHPATLANLDLLRARGVRIVEPDTGRLASKGEHGVGRLADPARLLEACELVLAGGSPAGGSLDGVSVLVTAGGTREAIDSVRYLGNSSSGRMGLALAQAAQARGASVTLVVANVALAPPGGVRVRHVVSAAQLKEACEEEFPSCEILLMAAAVADFRPAAAENGKIKKSARERLELQLEPTADVLSGLAQGRSDRQTLVGFAAEHGPEAVRGAREKLIAKGLDAIVVNDISRQDIGFDSEANEVTIFSAPRESGEIEEQHVPRAGKRDVAEAILDAAERLRTSG